MSSKASMNLVGRCGIYCGACPVFISKSEDEEFKKKTKESIGLSLEARECDGCGNAKANSPCSNCEIVACLDEKNFWTCYDCESFDKEDCEKFESIYKVFLDRSVDLRQNLEKLNSSNPEQWVAKNDQIYVCRSCGAKIPWGFSQCQRCGKPLF